MIDTFFKICRNESSYSVASNVVFVCFNLFLEARKRSSVKQKNKPVARKISCGLHYAYMNKYMIS